MKNRTILIATILAICQIILIGISHSRQTKPDDFGSQMVAYTKQGRYDDAIQVGINALQNQPSDEVVYQQIAIVYLIRAGKDETLREQWVSKAVSYTEKALSLNSKERDVAGVHVVQEALSFESAGDLAATERCAYYQQAKKLVTDRTLLLQGERLTIDGKVYPLAPLRKENDKILARMQKKAAKAECKEPADSPKSIANAMFPGAPQKAQSVDCFRRFDHNTSVNTVVQKCGSPDEELGSGVYIFVWHLADGATVTINTPYLSRIDYLGYRNASGKRVSLLSSKQ